MTTIASEPAALLRAPAERATVGVVRSSDLRLVAAAAPIALVILVGMVVGSSQLMVAGSLGAFAAAVLSPAVGLVLIAFTGPLKAPEAIPAPGFNILLVGAALLGCVYRLPIDRPRIRLSASFFLLSGFFLYVFVQQAPEMLGGYVGEEPHRIGYQFIQLSALVGTAVVAGFVLRGRSPYIFVGSVLGGACVAAFIALASYDAGTASPFGGIVAMTDDGTRAVGPFGNPNYFGHFLATAIAAAVGWALGTRRRMERILLGGVVLLAAAALAISLSRGAIAALLVGLACLAVVRNRMLGGIVAALALLGTLVIYPAFVEWRLGPRSGVDLAALNASDAARLDAVLAGPQLFLSSPLFGVGFGHYSVLSARVTETHISIGSHNWYMNILAEQGIVGAVLWGLLLVAVLRELQIRPEPARLVGFAVLPVFAVGSMFTTQPASFQTAMLPVLAIVAALVADWGRDGPVVDAASLPATLRRGPAEEVA